MKKCFIENVLDIFPPDEGSIDQFYGRIGSGKTYMATKDVLADLKAGQVVYCNWKINWPGYDQRQNWFPLLLGLIGLKRNFYVYPASNLHYLPIDENFFDTLKNLTDCSVYLDEGHLAFDSYELTRMPIAKRAMVLHTRHYDRRIVIISQRSNAIHVTLRANVNRFFKCEKLLSLFGLIIFRKTEYQDLTGDEKVDEDQPISSELYLGRAKIFNCYNTKYLRNGAPSSQLNQAEIWNLTWKDILENLKNKIKPQKKLSTAYQDGLLKQQEYFAKLKKYEKN